MGWFYIILGLLCNRWLIGWLFASNGTIESRPLNLALLALQALLIGFGLLCLHYKTWRPLTILSNLGITVISLLLMLFLLDWGIAQSPLKERLMHVAHQANLDYTIDNLEFNYRFRTNSHGLRDDEVPLRKPADVWRVVVLGDSYVEGTGVEAEETFSSQIEQMAAAEGKKLELINCGLSGTGTLYHARILVHLCLHYEPDTVLIAVHANDVTETAPDSDPSQIERVSIEKQSGLSEVLQSLWPQLFALWQRAQKSLAKQNEQTTSASWVANAKAQTNAPEFASKIVTEAVTEARRRGYSPEKIQTWLDSLPPDLLTAADQNHFNGYMLAAGLLNPTYWIVSLDIDGKEGGSESAETQFTAMMSIHAAMLQTLRSRAIAVGMVYLPSPFQYDARYGQVWRETGTIIHAGWASEKTELERRLEMWANQQQVPYLSLTPNFQTLTKAEPTGGWHFPLDGHYTAAGQHKVAGWLYPWLKGWTLR